VVKKILSIAGIVLAILLVLMLITVNVLFLRYDEMKTVEKIALAGNQTQNALIDYGDGYVINAWCIGNPENRKALLIHGSPGHWVDWVELYTNKGLIEDYCLVTFDRPGYGGTTVPPDGSLEVQADIAARVMEYFCGEDACYSVVGHSYGGSVVEEVLINHPTRAIAGIYVAGTLSPEHQPRRWYNHVAAWRPVQWVIPEAFVASNIEMMILADELRKNEGLQANITQPITLIQGTSDLLVPYETVEYYKNIKPDGVEYVIVEGLNHFIPWTDPYLVIDALRRY
jgi:pimeloyl-ACP methyl ester carboxylesterase